MNRYDELLEKYDELTQLSKELALALADEVAFVGSDAAEASLKVLAVVRVKLGLGKEFDAIDTRCAGYNTLAGAGIITGEKE